MKMRSLFASYLLMAVSLGVLVAAGVERGVLVGFGVGLALFAANAFLLFFVGSRMFATAGDLPSPGEGAKEKKRPSLGLLLALLAKALILAVITFIAMVVYHVQAEWFVGGAFVGLCCLLLGTWYERLRTRRRHVSCGSTSAARSLS